MARTTIQQYGNLADPARAGIQEIEYAGGQVGRRAQGGGWAYDFRPESYQDALGQHELEQQLMLRDARASGNLAEDDAGALKALQGGGQAAPQNQTPAQQWNAQPAQAAPVAAPAATGAPTAGTGNELMQLLMQRAMQPSTAGREDPNVRAQADAFSAQTERASRNYIDDVAERSGPLANIQGERRLAAERAGQASGAFEAEVMGRESMARRDEIAQALSMWGAMLSDDQRMQLQRELAALDAQLSREGMGIQRRSQDIQREGLAQGGDQFMRELALREYMAGEDNAFRWATL